MWNRETQRGKEKGSMVVLRESDTERRLQVDSEFLEAFWYLVRRGRMLKTNDIRGFLYIFDNFSFRILQRDYINYRGKKTLEKNGYFIYTDRQIYITVFIPWKRRLLNRYRGCRSFQIDSFIVSCAPHTSHACQ